MKLHLKAFCITMFVLGLMAILWYFAEYYPRQTLKVMLVIMGIGLPTMIYYLTYKALKNE